MISSVFCVFLLSLGKGVVAQIFEESSGIDYFCNIVGGYDNRYENAYLIDGNISNSISLFNFNNNQFRK